MLLAEAMKILQTCRVSAVSSKVMMLTMSLLRVSCIAIRHRRPIRSCSRPMKATRGGRATRP